MSVLDSLAGFALAGFAFAAKATGLQPTAKKPEVLENVKDTTSTTIVAQKALNGVSSAYGTHAAVKAKPEYPENSIQNKVYNFLSETNITDLIGEYVSGNPGYPENSVQKEVYNILPEANVADLIGEYVNGNPGYPENSVQKMIYDVLPDATVTDLIGEYMNPQQQENRVAKFFAKIWNVVAGAFKAIGNCFKAVFNYICGKKPLTVRANTAAEDRVAEAAHASGVECIAEQEKRGGLIMRQPRKDAPYLASKHPTKTNEAYMQHRYAVDRRADHVAAIRGTFDKHIPIPAGSEINLIAEYVSNEE